MWSYQPNVSILFSFLSERQKIVWMFRPEYTGWKTEATQSLSKSAKSYSSISQRVFQNFTEIINLFRMMLFCCVADKLMPNRQAWTRISFWWMQKLVTNAQLRYAFQCMWWLHLFYRSLRSRAILTVVSTSIKLTVIIPS